MAAAFAAIESATAASAVAALANVTADFGGGVEVEGIFDAAYADVFGISGNRPVLRVTDADLDSGGIAAGDSVTINSVGYTISRIEADGTGMSLLVLEAA